MPNSRLEKFIHAICAMDVSDLPTPLSRIEILWNCLITGETPNFEPLSRNEKYLMAMLDRYDINNLPAPMSRGEKLLYKIAVGDTDLTDVPEYSSKYEELLKYLIENGGISGSDFEYILYSLNQPLNTLYSTAEGPVKSAILKGQTVDNIVDFGEGFILTNGVKDFNFLFPPKLNKEYRLIVKLSDIRPALDADDYIAIRGVRKDGGVEELARLTQSYNNGSYEIPCVFTKDYAQFRIAVRFTATIQAKLKGGLISCKMPVLCTTGKNLLNFEKTQTGYLGGNPYSLNAPDYSNKTSDYIRVKPDTTYTYSFDGFAASQVGNEYWTGWYYYTSPTEVSKKNMNRQVKRGSADTFKTVTFTTPSDCYYVRIGSRGLALSGAVAQLEEGTQATTYEPYKSNILSIDGEYRGIGDVRDTVDYLTGEKVERIGEVVLDGSENWQGFSSIGGNLIRFYTGNELGVAPSTTANFYCDAFKVVDNRGVSTLSGECVFNNSTTGSFPNGIQFQVSLEKATNIVEWLEYLSQNPITVQYPLATPVNKTVDLTILDQDGQPTKLKTYNDITHVSIEAAGLIPTVDLEVPTKIEETLLSLGTQMDDILTIQQLLDESADEQTNNMDTIMMATTDIYEEII